ncbi:ribokinase [Salinisphaera sp. Q1T1-3]|uniref:ribokinase n=1 Tax=Salinisphaera sp. Q1T1-3 TaxID=2321229 RepID=UPI000E742591|nr:ribokinase [Salinisphaera sp. Q1T1-3]
MIIVAGSANIDLVARVSHHPAPGETLTASDYAVHDGGKGANQAVAAARVGGDVRFIGAVGSDDFGTRIRETLDREHIDTRGLATVSGASGIALINVDDAGENCIVVVPGANATLETIDDTTLFTDARVVLTQLETPATFVNATLTAGRAAGAETILNAAPAVPLATYATEALDWLMVNAGEAAMIGDTDEPDDIDAAAALAARLSQRYDVGVVVTLGGNGALWHTTSGETGRVPATSVAVVDTTGAGDTFAGVFAAARAEERPVAEAVRRAVTAGGLSVGAAGARAGMPVQAALDAVLP